MAKSKKKSKSSKATGLSKSEKAVLARFQKSTDVFEEYMSAVQELAAAQDAVEMAQKALHDIPREHITTIADVDPDAAELFRSFGLYDGSPAPSAESPDQPMDALEVPMDALEVPMEALEEPMQAPDQPTESPAQWTAPPAVEKSDPQGDWIQDH
jgi:hypothetical protein